MELKSTDLEGNKFIDMAQMAVGSAILGYSNTDLVKAVNKASKEWSELYFKLS